MDDEVTIQHKQQLRRSLRARRRDTYGGEAGLQRRAREAAALSDCAKPLLEEVTALVNQQPEDPPLVAAFHPTPTEADVMPLARALAGIGAQLIFPAAAGKELEWITWDGHSEFVPSAGKGFGREPAGRELGAAALARAAVVLAPAVAIDRAGTRIGHGAGYYDRALAYRCVLAGGRRVVGVIHPDELLEAGALPRGPHDVPIPEVLTAQGLVELVTGTGA